MEAGRCYTIVLHTWHVLGCRRRLCVIYPGLCRFRIQHSTLDVVLSTAAEGVDELASMAKLSPSPDCDEHDLSSYADTFPNWMSIHLLSPNVAATRLRVAASTQNQGVGCVQGLRGGPSDNVQLALQTAYTVQIVVMSRSQTVALAKIS